MGRRGAGNRGVPMYGQGSSISYTLCSIPTDTGKDKAWKLPSHLLLIRNSDVLHILTC